MLTIKTTRGQGVILLIKAATILSKKTTLKDSYFNNYLPLKRGCGNSNNINLSLFFKSDTHSVQVNLAPVKFGTD